MHRKSFLKLAALALGFLPLGWLASAAPAPAAASSVGGKTFGEWNLPTPGVNGFATGALLDFSGNTVFKMKAELVELPSPFLQRIGTIEGELDDGNPFPYPRYTVSGKWQSNLFGQGSFEATIAEQVSPLGPVAIIGKMAGKFSDPPSFPDQVGKYEGEWKAIL
ncbi:MAG: hypothetical protein AAF682_23280 [Planctomycetota bacterium]